MEIQERIRRIREEKGLKLTDLYDRIKDQFGPRAIDYSTLKRIQSGRTKPSEFSLYRISMGLGIKLSELEGEDDQLVKFIAKDKPEGHYDYTPVKAHADKLSTRRLKGMLPQKLHLAAQAKTRVEKDPEPANGVIYQKWIYGLKGKITCVIEDKKYVVGKGDICFFDSHHEHYFENTSAKSSACLVIQCPPYL